MDTEADITLPSYASYRQHCHSSSNNHLCYLSSTTQIKVLKLDEFKSSYSLEIPLEPLRSLELIQINNDVYVGVALVTRLIIFKNQEILHENVLQIQCNIVNFIGGYIAVCKSQINGNPVFIFIQNDGEVTICYLYQKKKILKSPQLRPIDPITSMGVNYPHIYLGNSRGIITLYQMNQNIEKYKKKAQYCTQSNLPILNIIPIPKLKSVASSTCFGQLLLCDSELKSCSIISANHSSISRMLFDEMSQTLIIFGEDGYLHRFKVSQGRRVSLIKSQKMKQLVNVIFRCKNGILIGFYEEKTLKKI